MDNTDPFRLVDLRDDPTPLPTPNRRRRLSTEPVTKLDLNTATVEELEALPGVGPLRARRILAWRERNGDFESLDDLRFVRGMGERSVMELAPYLFVADSDR